MRYLSVLFLLLLCGALAHAQIRTEETRTTTDSTGKTNVTQSVVISRSEDITPHSNMIVVNPLKFFLFYNISYFHRLNEGTALGFGVQTPTLSGISGFGVNAEVRLYPSQRSLRGFYIAPNFSYNRLESTPLFGDSKTLVSPMSLGVLFGWQWFPGDDFALGFGLGMDYYWSGDKEAVITRYDGTAPALRFDIGYGW